MQNISKMGPVILEKKWFEWFLPYMGMTPIFIHALFLLKSKPYLRVTRAVGDFPGCLRFGLSWFNWWVSFAPEFQCFSVGRPQTSISPPPPVIFIAGHPKAALLFWFFGDFRCGALLFVVIHVIFKYKNR